MTYRLAPARVETLACTAFMHVTVDVMTETVLSIEYGVIPV